MRRTDWGWDLPPGCRESDIPGNRPEDEAWESALEEAGAEWDLGKGADDLADAREDDPDLDVEKFEEKWIERRAERFLEEWSEPMERDYEPEDDR